MFVLILKTNYKPHEETIFSSIAAGAANYH